MVLVGVETIGAAGVLADEVRGFSGEELPDEIFFAQDLQEDDDIILAVIKDFMKRAA